MGMAGRRFAKTKNGRAVVIAILEEWSLICLVAVSTGAMIMVAVMLYNDGSRRSERPCQTQTSHGPLSRSAGRDVGFAPVRGHQQAASPCPKSATTDHAPQQNSSLFDHLIGK